MVKLMGPLIIRFLSRAWLCIPIFCVGFFFMAPQDAKGKGILSKLKKSFKARIKKEKTIPKRTSILYLGDSMSMGAFGKVFDMKLREAGFEVYTYVAGGATPYYWLSRYEPIASNIGFWEKTPTVDRRQKFIKEVPKVESLVENWNPDIVVIQTGINLYSSLRSKRREKSDNIAVVEGLCRDMAKAAVIGGRRCYWIAPPASHPERFPYALQDEMSSIMNDTVSPFGRVFDSRDVTKFVDPYPETDGIHYGPTEAREWAQHVMSDFMIYAGNDAVGRRALDPDEPFEAKHIEVKKAIPVDPSTIVWKEIDVKIRLKIKTEIPRVKAVTYRSCLVLYDYEVQEVMAGYYPYETLRVAHYGVFNRKYTAKSRYRLGFEKAWKMVPLQNYPTMSRLQMFDDLDPDFDKPIYIIKQE